MLDTDLAYAAICRRACYAMSGTEIAYAPMRCPVMTSHILLPAGISLRAYSCSYSHRNPGTKTPLPAYADAMRCPVLTSRMLLPGLRVRREPSSGSTLPYPSFLSCYGFPLWSPVLKVTCSPTVTVLASAYATSGTNLDAAMPQCSCYAMPSTDVVYAPIGLRAC
eukprot:3940745-Rhodomonas_salina.10